MKVVTVTHYACEVCGTEHATARAAAACEAHRPPLPAHIVVGGEVRLRNRNHGYTLAVVLGVRLERGFLAREAEHLIDDGCNPAHIAFHRWMLELDRPVHLDHAWGWTDEVEDFYALAPEHAAHLERNDNFTA